MPTFSHEVEFRLSDQPTMERGIVCGAENVPVVRQSGSFLRLGGRDVPVWLVIKPGSVEMKGGDLHATLMFGGKQTAFQGRCAVSEVATVNFVSSEDFQITVRFLP
jgi:hypothetical protein